jgi:hypothetical protein
MKRTLFSFPLRTISPLCISLCALAFILAAPQPAYASEQLVPAGSLIQCIVSEPKLSSKTEAIGDPVLCHISHIEPSRRSAIPYGSYLVGYFEDYKDPGHLVGKGWMELKFDRMVIEPDTVIPLSAKVVAVPKYNVDREGRILGKGHPVRDTVEWMIPVLWPIDLINLPRRGPRPVLKAETRLTLKLMDDLGLPMREEAPRQQAALVERRPAPTPVSETQPVYAQSPPPQQVIYQYGAPPPTQVVVYQSAPPPMRTVVMRPQVIYPYPYPYPPRVAAPYGYGYGPPAGPPAGYGDGYASY